MSSIFPVRYVLGFMFSYTKDEVVLIRKQRPLWQAGKLNGVGGKIEACEGIHEAMVREFKEETGYLTHIADWYPFAEMISPEFHAYCFKSFNQAAFEEAKTTEAEEIVKQRIADIDSTECISNLTWLIDMARDENDGRGFYATLKYT